MDINVEFLNYIHQNAEMGKDTISQLVKIAEDGPFKQRLERQLRGYSELYDKSKSKIEEAKKTSKGIESFTKFTTYLMINFNTLLDKTPSHMAAMVIQGSTMGIVDVTKRLKDYKEANKEISDLAHQLLIFEQQNIEEMKKFL